MKIQKWFAIGAAVLAVAAVSVWAISLDSFHFRVFRTTASFVAVSQTSSNDVPRYNVDNLAGHDLVALALPEGVTPTSNQVLAVSVNCDTTVAELVVFDKSNSNMTTIAQSQRIDKILQGNLRTTNVKQERFVGQFAVAPVGQLAGGYLTVAGRWDLDTNGCVKAVLIIQDRDRLDKKTNDSDVKNLDADRRERGDIIVRRAGQAHLIGVLDVVSGGQTNTVLIPNGHLTFRHQMDEFSETP